MARQYGEGFRRPADPFTGLPIPGAPAMAVMQTTRPSGPGYVVLRDENDNGPEKASRPPEGIGIYTTPEIV
jgi:hypothetical protein